MVASLLGDMPPDVPTGAPLPSGTPWFPTVGVVAPGADAGTDYAQQAEADAFLRARALKGVDTQSGAPFHVRMGVNLAPDDPSRLATMRAYAPDAQPFGSSNFIYTDPRSGVRTLYNPSGPSVGDIATPLSGIPGFVGGAAGSAAGLLGGPVASALGIGAGVVAGNEAATGLGREFFGTKDVRTPGQVVGQDVTQGAVNSLLAPIVGAGAGAIVSSLGRSAAAPAAAAAAALDRAGTTTGLADTLPAGVATGKPGWQIVDSSLAQTPGGRGAVLQKYSGTNKAMAGGVSNTADDVATLGGTSVPDPKYFSETVNNVATQMGKQWETNRNALDDAVGKAVGSDTPTDVTPLVTLKNQLDALNARAPRTQKDVYGPAISELEDMVEDAGDAGTLPFSVLQKARSRIGNMSYGTMPGDKPPDAEGALKQVYGALDQSIGDQVNQSGQPAIDAYRTYMDAVRNYRTDPVTGNDKLSTAEAVRQLQNPNKGSDYLLDLASSDNRQQQATFANFMNNANATPEQRAQLVSGMVARMGYDSGGNFSATQLARDWGGLSDRAKDIMMPPGTAADAQRQALDQLATVGGGVKDSLATKAFSNTPASSGMMNTIGAAIGALMFGHPLAAAGIVGGNIAGPAVGARLLQSPAFVRWLSGGLADQTGNLGRVVAGLPAVAAADPSVRDYVNQLHDSLAARLPAPAGPGVGSAAAPTGGSPAGG